MHIQAFDTPGKGGPDLVGVACLHGANAEQAGRYGPGFHFCDRHGHRRQGAGPEADIGEECQQRDDDRNQRQRASPRGKSFHGVLPMPRR